MFKKYAKKLGAWRKGKKKGEEKISSPLWII
jgi:hypothetical protein